MDEIGKIYEAISNVMAEIGAIGKEKKNIQQGFMYRGIDDVMNALQPALVKHKVFIVPDVIKENREERTNKNGTLMFYTRLDMEFKFYTIDGSYITAKVLGEAMDSGDKVTNKAMSIAYKYVCFQVFCIPTEEMIDPDAQCHEPTPKQESKKQTEKPKQTQPQPPKDATTKQIEDVANHKIDAVKVKVIQGELDRTGVSEKAICGRYKFDKLEDCTEDLFVKVVNALKNTKSKES